MWCWRYQQRTNTQVVLLWQPGSKCCKMNGGETKVKVILWPWLKDTYLQDSTAVRNSSCRFRQCEAIPWLGCWTMCSSWFTALFKCQGSDFSWSACQCLWKWFWVESVAALCCQISAGELFCSFWNKHSLFSSASSFLFSFLSVKKKRKQHVDIPGDYVQISGFG